MIKDKGIKLRNLRTACGLSQADFGDKIGVSRASIAGYENNINPIPTTVMWKITQATGIGNDYFLTDMDLSEALHKYGVQLDVSKGLKVSGIKESVCAVFNGLNAYISKEYLISDFILNTDILGHILKLNGSYNYDFIVVNGDEAKPFANDGDTLIVARGLEPKHNDLVITTFSNSPMVLRYFISGVEQITLKDTKDTEIVLKKDEIKSIEILGVIKQKVALGFES